MTETALEKTQELLSSAEGDSNQKGEADYFYRGEYHLWDEQQKKDSKIKDRKGEKDDEWVYGYWRCK